MTDRRSIGVFSTLISSLIWGFSFISLKILLDYMNPITIAFFRYVIATIFLFIFLKIMKVKQNIKRKDLVKIAISGTLGITFYFYLVTIALKTISASMAGLLNGAIPILTLVVEVLFLGKRVTKTMLFAFLLSALGIFLTVIESSSLADENNWSGYIFMTLAIICWITYTFITPDLLKKYSSIHVLSYQTLFATISLLPFAAVGIYNADNFLEIISLKSVMGNLLFLGIFCSAGAYYLYVIGLNYLGSSTTSIFMNFIPMVSMIGAYFMLDEAITYTKFIGLCMVITSILLVNFDGSIKWKKTKKKWYRA